MIYIFNSRARADDAYEAFQKAAGLPRKSADVVHRGKGVHVSLVDTFDPNADRNPGWDRDETGRVTKHPTRGEYAVSSTSEAQQHEGKTVDVRGNSVKLPSSADRKPRSIDWDGMG